MNPLYRFGLPLSARLWPLFLLLGMAWGVPVQAQEVEILHFNDFHGQVSPRGSVGGVRALASAIAAVRTEVGADKTLTLDAGDWYQGTPEGNVSKGELIVELYNAMGVDVAAIGNHEFDMGAENVQKLLKLAQFPVVGANVQYKNQQLWPGLKAVHIIERGAIRFGVIGILTPETPKILRRDVAELMQIAPPAEICRQWIPKLRQQGAECIVVLSHLGLEAERRLAEEVAGIHLIVGGHSHSKVDVPWVGPTHGTVVAQAGSRSAYLGRLKVRRVGAGFNITGGLQALAGIENPLQGHPIEPILQRWLPRIQAEMDQEIGQAAESLLPNDRRGSQPPQSSALGTWLCQVMARSAGTEIALHNVGGIRDQLNAGPLTKRSLFQVSPFGNRVVRVQLPGAVLGQILEQAFSGVNAKRLEASGLEIYWQLQDGERRFSHVKVAGIPLNPDQLYTIATNSFIAEDSGDGWTQFREFGTIENIDKTLYQVTLDAVTALTTSGQMLRRPTEQATRRTVALEPLTELGTVIEGPRVNRVYPTSTRLGSWLTTLMLESVEADAAWYLLNTGTSLPRGPLTTRGLYQQLTVEERDARPHEVVVYSATGKQISEWVSSRLVAGNNRWIETSGMTVRWVYDAKGPRVHEIRFADEALVSNKNYRIATTRSIAHQLGWKLTATQATKQNLFQLAVQDFRSSDQAGDSWSYNMQQSYPQQGSYLQKLIGLLGLFSFMGIAFLISRKRRQIKYRPVLWGVSLQFVIAFLVLETAWGVAFFDSVKHAFTKVMDFSAAGSAMVFGSLADSSQVGFVFFTQITGTIILVSALTAILYHIGIMQVVVYGLAKVMQWTMRTSGAESLASAANIFVGQTEAPLTVRPYLKKMTASEINSMMCGGMATVAGGVLAAYVGFGIDAGHLLAASVMSAPAALAIAKILVPETEESETSAHVPFKINRIDSNALDAVCRGAGEGMKLSLNVMAMLIAVVSIVALLNYLLDGLYQNTVIAFLSDAGSLASASLPTNISLEYLLGQLFRPLAWLLGVPWQEADTVGSFLGTRMVLNEFIAYDSLANNLDVLCPRSSTLATYALCGFANFSSIAIQIGGISSLEGSTRERLAKYGLLSMIGGTLATLMTASIAGVFL